MKATLPHILIIDDDERLRRLIKKYLDENGFVAVTARDAVHAREVLQYLIFDLLILDVMMPGESGFAFLKELRETSQIPVLMLTAQGEPHDRISGLEAGADDYLAKPFEPKELSLRIKAILKRLQNEFKFGGFTLSYGVLKKAGEIVNLTAAEEKLLKILSEKNGEVANRAELSQQLNNLSERAIDVQINRLRKKIEDNPRAPVYIQSVRGKGYRLKI